MPTAVISTSLAADQLDDALALAVVVLDEQEVLDRPVDELLESRPAPRSAPRGRPASRGSRRRRACRPRCVSSSTEMTWTGMWRVRGSCLRRSSSVQPSMSGQPEVERDRVRLVARAPAPAPSSPSLRDQALEALLARQLEQDRRERRVVLDDEQDAVAGLDGVPVVGEADERHRRRWRLGRPRPSSSPSGGDRGADAAAAATAGGSMRQVQRERAALARLRSTRRSRRRAAARSRG